MTFWTAGAILGSSLIGGMAASDAASVQAGAADRTAELQYRQNQENVARQKPFYDVGVNALPELVQASRYTPFSMSKLQQDPGYAFRLSEGQKLLDRTAARDNRLFSGGALKAATRYGQDMGSQEYMSAFNRYQIENAARLQPLQSLTGMAQTTANTLGTAGQNMASSVGDAMGSAAAARASGYVGGANALTSGLGTYLNYNQGNNMLSALRGRGNSSGLSGRWNPETGTFGD